MKVLYRVICLAALVVLLTACGGKATPTATEPTAAPTEMPMDMNMSPTATEAPTATEMPVETASADPFELSVAQHVMDAAGFHEIATALSETQTIDPEYFSTVTGVSAVLSHTTWPAELNDQAQAFIESLGTFAAALEADNAADAVELSETVHDAQHELSHAVEHWLGDAPAVTTEASSFDVSVAQYIMDGAGFHEIATALSETQTIDPEYYSTVTGVSAVLSHTTWPAELNDQAQAFIESLDAFAKALEADNTAEAVTLSDTVHEAQHEFSHAVEHWLGDAMNMSEPSAFDLGVAQYIMDSAGFHEMATALSETQTIDPESFSVVSGVNAVLHQTAWPAELNDEAQAFIASLDSFASALETDNIADAVELSETVHDAQHDFSHSIEHWLESNAH